ncbi:chaoptin-like [Culicoides brevitarsis]|uniref:chaoptin-like n=1 Tax=Culicoides brevitarsis TaxID=469753 RepID=UPI00307C79B3
MKHLEFGILCLLIFCLDTHAITFVCNGQSCNSDNIKISANHEITIRLDEFDDHIEFKDSVIPQILRVVVSVPENINNFIATRSAIGQIQPMAFKQLFGLYTLNLAENFLTSVDEKHFSGLTQLRWMFLSHNKISQIHPNAFKTMAELEYLNISSNQLQTLDKKVFTNLKKLEAIYLDHNRLSVLPRTIFERNRNLRFVDVSHNQLMTFNLVFHDSLFMLNLAFNEIESFKVDFKTESRPDGDISILRLENNHLHDISNVTSLNLSFELSLANNLIAYHRPDSLDQLNPFDNMKNLWSLNISNTGFHFGHVSSTNDNPFGKMSELKELDLSYNDLREINLMQIRVMELRSLQLNGNNLTELNIAPIGRILPNLRALEISDNKFNCTYLRMLMQQLNQEHHARLEISIRDDLTVKNSTHVNGVGCIDLAARLNKASDGIFDGDKMNEHDTRLKVLEERIDDLFQKLNQALELQQNFAKVLRNFTRTFEYGT